MAKKSAAPTVTYIDPEGNESEGTVVGEGDPAVASDLVLEVRSAPRSRTMTTVTATRENLATEGHRFRVE